MPKAPARGAAAQPHTRSFRPVLRRPNQVRVPNRRSTSVATITGQRARSTLPACDTPGGKHPDPDGLSRTAAEAAWQAVTASLAGTQHVRISRDGGRTYPARHARPLPAAPPDQPSTVPVFDAASGTGRMLALDLDPGRAGRDVHDGAVEHHHEHGAAEVRAQAEALAGLVAHCGGQVARRCLAVRRPSRLRAVRRSAAVARAARRRPGPGAPVLRRSTRRRCPASAARSHRLAAVTSPEAGECCLRL